MFFRSCPLGVAVSYDVFHKVLDDINPSCKHRINGDLNDTFVIPHRFP